MIEPDAANQATESCRNCGQTLAPSSVFCRSCGAKVEKSAARPPAPEPPTKPEPRPEPTSSVPTCSSCGAALVPGCAFCRSCGTPVGAVTPRAPASPPPPTPPLPAAAATPLRPPNRGRSWLPFAIAAVILIVGAGVAAAIVLRGSSESLESRRKHCGGLINEEHAICVAEVRREEREALELKKQGAARVHQEERLRRIERKLKQATHRASAPTRSTVPPTQDQFEESGLPVSGRDARGFNFGPGCSDDPANPLPGCSDSPSVPAGDPSGTCPNGITVDSQTTTCGLAENVYFSYIEDGPVTAESPKTREDYVFTCRTAGPGTTEETICLGRAGSSPLYVIWHR